MIYSDFLTRVLTRSYHEPDGCGMSTRPEYYSGRGANPGDLRPDSLEKIYQAILTNVSKEAADAFAQMVLAIPRLTATDFLIALRRLESNNWVWEECLLGDQKGIYAGNFVEGVGTIMSVLGGMNDRDETVSIRWAFLKKHGLKEPARVGKKGVVHNYDPFGCAYANRWKWSDDE